MKCMATTAKQDKASRKYYATHKAYRKKKIEQTQRKQKSDKEEYNKSKREYYAKNPSYRRYKQMYAKAYRKREPEKSKAKKYRNRVK